MKKKTTKPQKLKGTGLFDYAGIERGYFAILVNDRKSSVTLTEWPGSLVSMGRVGALQGEALKDYINLVNLQIPGA